MTPLLAIPLALIGALACASVALHIRHGLRAWCAISAELAAIDAVPREQSR